MKPPHYRILANQEIQANYYLLSIEGFPQSNPGQFVNILCQSDDRFMLRRPFCINNVVGSETHILYKVIGPGTKLLATRQAGELLDVLGPLGQGWIPEGVRNILVGGGIGIAPLLYLANKLSAQARSDATQSIPITVLLGGRSKADILCQNEFEALGCTVQVATDDGSLGVKGLVTDLLKNIIGPQNHIYACGPHQMLKAVAFLSMEHNSPCQVSLEAMMGCGLGGCVCCVCATKYGYEKVCSKGPVFDANDIVW